MRRSIRRSDFFWAAFVVVMGAVGLLLGMLDGCVAASVVAQVKCPWSYADDRYEETGRDITRIVVPAHLGKSPMGIPIGPGVDGVVIDRAFTDVARCLGVEFHACAVHVVFIAPDSRTMLNADGVMEQGFPCVKPGPVSAWCTGVNQWPASIILTPDLHMARWEAERMLLRDDPNKDGGRECWRVKSLVDAGIRIMVEAVR